MKIIQITGLSGTGKTSLIKNLIPVLGTQGSVAVIKHLGDHSYILEPGKDTTEFFTAGAKITVGIDTEKSVAVLQTQDLEEILALLESTGIDFAVIEGFKARSFAKVVIGDLETENGILRNPSVPDIIANINRFDDYRSPPKTRRKRRR